MTCTSFGIFFLTNVKHCNKPDTIDDVLFSTSDAPGEQARPRNGTRPAVPVQQAAAAEERGAGMPRRRRRDMAAGMANRRPQRDVVDLGRRSSFFFLKNHFDCFCLNFVCV